MVINNRYCVCICWWLLICMSSLGQCQRGRKIETQLKVGESLQLFASDMFKTMGRSGNSVVSPLSLFSSLSMISLGARGSTLNQIKKALRLSPDALIRKGKMASMIESLKEAEEADVVMNMANFLWVPRGVTLKAGYARSVQEVFGTRVRDADFNRPEQVRLLINKRISNMTRGNIKDILPSGSVSSQTKMILANALYFKGQWLHPFNISETSVDPFFMLDGSAMSIPTMHISETFRGAVYDELDAKAIYMPYQGNRYGLILVLPNRNQGLADLETKLMEGNYSPADLFRKMIHRDVNLTLPRFKIQFDMEMTNTLKKMGITQLFGSDADLSKMSSSPLTSTLKVSNVFHRATIEVNEGGSEASAASGFEITPLIGGSGFKGPIEFKADHPFVFYLIDRDNDNMPIFMGRFQDPILNQDFKNTKTQKTEPLTSQINRIPSSFRPSGFPQPSRNNRPQFVNPNGSDQVVFPSETSTPYVAFLRRIAARPEVIRTPVLFIDDDDEVTIRRNTRSTTAETEAVQEPDLRVNDKEWFNKPTAAEVIIPINSTNNGSETEEKPSVAAVRPINLNTNPARTTTTTTTTTQRTPVVFATAPGTNPGSVQFTPPGIWSTTPPSIFRPMDNMWSGSGQMNPPSVQSQPPQVPPLLFGMHPSNWFNPSGESPAQFKPHPLLPAFSGSGSGILFPELRAFIKSHLSNVKDKETRDHPPASITF